jgi:ribitol-5-phosphate 2-dehydrogenase
LIGNNDTEHNSANKATSSVFMGSGYDGICQDRMVVPGDNIVKIPDTLDEDVAYLVVISLS